MDNFSRYCDRAEDYACYRPGYPDFVVDVMEKKFGMRVGDVIADVGAGTGLFSELLLRRGYGVIAVEPGDEMRGLMVERLGGYEGFRAVGGCAEETGLENDSVDYVFVAQAFHWFDHDKFRAEYQRILRAGGRIVLVWNNRDVSSTPFLVAYEQAIKRFGVEYENNSYKRFSPADLCRLLRVEELECFTTEGVTQRMPIEAFLGRTRSSSWCPGVGDSEYEMFMEELRRLFAMYAVGGVVELKYVTMVFVSPAM